MEQSSPAVDGPLERRVRPLALCALCGDDKGYTLGVGDTYRWWTVCCGSCGRQVGECRSDGNTSMNAAKPLSWPAADAVWNEAGAHAEKLRADSDRYRWLAGNGWAEPALYVTGPREWGANGVALLAGPHLDAAIDAAMAEDQAATDGAGAHPARAGAVACRTGGALQAR